MKWFTAAEITLREDVVATAEQNGCFINLETKRPILIPEPLVRAYQQTTQEES